MKKILSAVVVLCLIFSANFVTFAASSTGALVTSNVEVSYTINIPASIDFGTLTKGTNTVTTAYTVSTTGNLMLEPGKCILVTAARTGILNNQMDSSSTFAIPFTNDMAWHIFTGRNSDPVTGNLSVDTSKINFAGNYSGTLIFNISYQSIPA